MATLNQLLEEPGDRFLERFTKAYVEGEKKACRKRIRKYEKKLALIERGYKQKYPKKEYERAIEENKRMLIMIENKEKMGEFSLNKIKKNHR